MKVITFVFLALCLTGCASKYSSNPGAALIGPGYLDTIAEYPRDCDTQYYYPGFRIQGYEPSSEATTPLPKPDLSPAVAARLMQLPGPTRHVKDITGKGYPCLERTSGMLLFTSATQR